MPPVFAASFAWAKIVLLSGCAAKFILMPVFAVKSAKTFARSKPDQPMKLSSPDVAKASRTIQGAATAAAPAFRITRRVVLDMAARLPNASESRPVPSPEIGGGLGRGLMQPQGPTP